MEPVTNQRNTLLLKTKKTKYLPLIGGGLLFLLGGIVLFSDNQVMLGLLTGGFGLLGLIVLLAMIFVPNSSWLLLSPEGFTVRTVFKGPVLTRWKDVKVFEAKDLVTAGDRVTFNYSDSYKQYAVARAFAVEIGGAEAALPDTYGMKSDKLASLLNQWLQQYRDSSS